MIAVDAQSGCRRPGRSTRRPRRRPRRSFPANLPRHRTGARRASASSLARGPGHQRGGAAIQHAALDDRAGDVLRVEQVAEAHQVLLPHGVRLRAREDRPIGFLQLHEHPLVALAQAAQRRLETLGDERAQPPPALLRRIVLRAGDDAAMAAALGCACSISKLLVAVDLE